MYKIENFLLVKADKSNTISVIQQFLKESSLLISNLYNTYIIKKQENTPFPYKGEEYDASWYKNILIASWIIDDRLNGQILEKKPYIEILKKIDEISFASFAKKWNAINLVCSFNLSESEWIKLSDQYKLFECSSKLQALIDSNIQFDMQKFNTIAIDLNQYKTVTKIIQDQPVIEQTIVEVEQAPEINDTYEDKVVFDNLDIHLTNESIKTNDKELELVLQWLNDNKVQIKKYRTIARLNATPGEYEHIAELISSLNNEINSNLELLSTIKTKLPNHPLLNDLLELSNWSTERNNSLDSHIKFEENKTIPAEIRNIESEIKNVENEIFLIDSTYKKLKENKPNPEGLKDIENILSWIAKKEEAIKTQETV